MLWFDKMLSTGHTILLPYVGRQNKEVVHIQLRNYQYQIYMPEEVGGHPQLASLNTSIW